MDGHLLDVAGSVPTHAMCGTGHSAPFLVLERVTDSPLSSTYG